MKFLKIITLLFIIWIITLIGIIGAVLITSQTIPTEGAVKGIGVQLYWDSARTQPCTSINWGTIENNTQATRTIYIYNNGTSPETLSMSTSGWNATGLTFTWDRFNYLLPAKTVIDVIFTLNVATTAEAFKFDITITGTA
jgi:hypothetical protein